VQSYASKTWPPPRTSPAPLAGHLLDDGELALVGAEIVVPEGPGTYGVRGLRIDYSQGFRRYRAEVGPNVVFRIRE
jgi:hypothetical protein